jgi:hypothetical protein
MCRALETPLAALLLLIAFVATNLVRAPNGFDDFLALRVTVKNLLLVVGFALCWRLAAAAVGVYNWDRVRTRRAEAGRVFLLCTMMSLVALVFPAISVTGAFGYSTVIAFWALSAPVLIAARALLRAPGVERVPADRSGSGPSQSHGLRGYDRGPGGPSDQRPSPGSAGPIGKLADASGDR